MNTPRYLSLLVAVLVGTPAVADAFPVHRRMFGATYGAPVRCEACHARGGGNRRNGYGDAWMNAGENMAAFAKIEGVDSDGDGIPNGDEIRGGSNPGDAKSTPSDPGRRWKGKANVPVPSSQLELVFGHVDRIEAVELDLDAAKADLIAKKLGRPLREEERFPTIYFAVQGDKRVAAALFAHRQESAGRYTVLVSLDAKGRVAKAALFRAGNDDGAALMPLMACLEGHGPDDLPTPGKKGCPSVGAAQRSVEPIRELVRSALVTVGIALTRGA